MFAVYMDCIKSINIIQGVYVYCKIIPGYPKATDLETNGQVRNRVRTGPGTKQDTGPPCCSEE